ncbi:MAG: phosphatidate cytidylyltransferase [Acidobacteriota bacterium]
MNILKRTLTALVLLPLVFLLVQFSSRILFFIVIQIIVILALNEFYNLSQKKRVYPNKALGIIFSLLIGMTFLLKEFPLGMALLAGLLIFTIGYLISVKTIEELMAFPAELSLTFFGAFYLSFTLNHINLIRNEYGPFYIYFLLAVVFLGDSFAFFIGKKWGKHKMASLASPNKTWEGSAAGLFLGTVMGLVVAWVLFGSEFLLWKVVMISILIQIVIQLSDPLESMFKRAAGVKDSSNILPGHGGVLDRTDSLVLAIPFFYCILKYLGMN